MRWLSAHLILGVDGLVYLLKQRGQCRTSSGHVIKDNHVAISFCSHPVIANGRTSERETGMRRGHIRRSCDNRRKRDAHAAPHYSKPFA
jgi:hypothetical protein